MNNLIDYLPYLFPLILIQLILMVIGLRDVLMHTEYKVGTRTMWILIVVFVNIFGPIAYFIWGKKEL